jgi:hypothetical protein
VGGVAQNNANVLVPYEKTLVLIGRFSANLRKSGPRPREGFASTFAYPQPLFLNELSFSG